MKTIRLTEANIKHLGRTLSKDDLLWLGLSGSGVEFDFTGKSLKLSVKGDDHTQAETDHARLAVYVDNKRILDVMVMEPSCTYSITESTEKKSHTIRIMKLSEAPMSIVALDSLTMDEEATITATPAKERKIEFVGDSITCGYGVDDRDLTHIFKTSTEDVTRAYAYLTSQKLNADYSIVSYSGYGVYSGYTGDENVQNTPELVPPFYEKVAFSRGTVNGEAITMTDWNFSDYIPDLVVINLGTNDDSYCTDHEDRQKEFVSCYKSFVKTIRKNNPSSHILCVYGMMNNRLDPWFHKMMEEYKSETGDNKIDYLLLKTQTEEDGYVVDYHPTPEFHEQSSETVVSKIRDIMKW